MRRGEIESQNRYLPKRQRNFRRGGLCLSPRRDTA